MLVMMGDFLAVLASTDATRKLILHQAGRDKHRLDVMSVCVCWVTVADVHVCYVDMILGLIGQ